MRLRDFIPPIFIKIQQTVFPLKIEPIREYLSYEAAEKDSVNNGYQNSQLCEMIADKTVIVKDQKHILNSATAFLFAALKETQPSVVLDFGGACGTHYFWVRKFINPVKWIVVETPQMVRSARSRNLQTDELIFADSFNDLPGVDLVYTSGAMQYVSKPYEYLDKLLNVDAKNILFNRMVFSENNREFITVQKSMLSDNGPGKMPDKYRDREIYYPHTTLSFNKFNSFVSKKYKLEWQFDESSDSYKVDGEPTIGCGLFYTKII